MKKRLSTSLSLLLALILLVSSIPFAFAADPVLIATAEDFIKFTNGDASADAVLDADIDLGEWTTAFTDGYSGTFDGNGHSITYTITDATANFQSLFHTLTGTIKNLNVSGNVSVKGTRTGRNYHGGVVYQNNGTIDNCKSSVNFRCSDTIAATKNVKYVGGIAGKNAGTIQNCVYDGTIDNITTYGGGIVAENTGGNVKNCINKGSITVVNASGFAGGIIAVVTAPAQNIGGKFFVIVEITLGCNAENGMRICLVNSTIHSGNQHIDVILAPFMQGQRYTAFCHRLTVGIIAGLVIAGFF